MNPENLRFVLVETSHPGNIGAAARAMKTMCLSRLHLVAPQRFPDEEAQARASGAVDLLEAAGVHESLDDALRGAGLVLGLSARPRTLSSIVIDPREAAEMAARESANHPVAILFGRERSGLTNDEMDRCHHLVHIPANPEYSSLNLGAAVQVMAYELRMVRATEADLPQPGQYFPPAGADEMEMLFEHLERVLKRIDFLREENPRALMRRLRLMFNRTRPDVNEVQILRGILAHVEKSIGD